MTEVPSARRLSSVIQLQEGDCLVHNITQLAALYGISTRRMTQELGIPLPHNFTYAACYEAMHPNRLGQLSSRLGYPELVLRSTMPQALAPTAPRPSRRERGRVRPGEWLHADAVPICPPCLADRPWAVRQEWRIPYLPVCPEHAVVLVRSCPNPRCTLPLRSLAAPGNGTATCPHCHMPIVDMPVTALKQVPGLRDAARLVSEAVRDRVAAANPYVGALDLVAVTDVLSLLLPSTGASSDGRLKTLILKPRVVAQVLPTAVRIAQAAPGSLPTDDVALLTRAPVASRLRLLDTLVGSDSWRTHALLLATGSSRANGRAALPSVTQFQRGEVADAPRLIPSDIFRLTLADVLFDAWTAAGTEIPAWRDARAAADILIREANDPSPLHHHDVTVNDTPHLLALAADARIGIRLRGSESALQGAITVARQLLDTWVARHRSRLNEPPDVLHARYVAYADADVSFEEWYHDDYLGGLAQDPQTARRKDVA